MRSDFKSIVASPVTTSEKDWSRPPLWETFSCHFPVASAELGSNLILSILFVESLFPFGIDSPDENTFPLYVTPFGEIISKSRSLTNLDTFWSSLALPATSVHARVTSNPADGSISNWYNIEKPADIVLEFSK